MARVMNLLIVVLVAGSVYATTIQVPSEQPTIQAGINAAVNGDTVLVAPGTYIENVSIDSKQGITLTSSAGRGLTEIRTPMSNPAISLSNPQDSTSIIRGFTIKNVLGGYGVDNTAGAAIIENCDIDSCVIGINSSTAIKVRNCLIQHSIVRGFSSEGSKSEKVEIAYSTFSDNEGVGILVWGPTGYIHHNLVRHNGSWGIYSLYGLTFNNTVVSNAQGLFIYYDSAFNNIAVSNDSDGLYPVYSTADYNDVWQNGGSYNVPGPHGISVDPLFTDTLNQDYTLGKNSPCINSGDPNPQYSDTDSTRSDIGAFYYPHVPRTFHVPSEYPTIQTAVDRAYDGDTVLLAPGTYSGEGNRNISITKSILIRGEKGPDSTIIDGLGEQYYGFDLTGWPPPDSTVIMSGLKIINCVTGVYLANFSGLSLDSCVFSANGCGIAFSMWSPNGPLVFRDCHFFNNGSGLFFEGGAPAVKKDQENPGTGYSTKYDEPATVLSNPYRNYIGTGKAPWIKSQGAMIESDSSNSNLTQTRFPEGYLAEFHRCKFDSNRTAWDGEGGIMATAGLFDSCLFSSNEIAVHAGCTISNSQLTDNLIAFTSVVEKEINAYSSTISSCRTQIGYVGGGGSIDSYLLLVDCIIHDNNGGLGMGPYAEIKLQGCLYSSNAEPVSLLEYPGVAYLHNEISGCTFVDNAGDAILVDCLAGIPQYTAIFGNIIAFNRGAGIRLSDCSVDTANFLTCSDVFSNDGGNYLGIPDQTGINNNFSADPLFCNAAQDSFYVRDISPCAPANNSCHIQIGAYGVGCQNIRPEITSLDKASATENERFLYRATATDPDGPTLTFSFIEYPNNWLTADADSVYGTPHYENRDTGFTLIASDGYVADTQSVTVVVHRLTPEVTDVRVDYESLNLHVVSHTPELAWTCVPNPDWQQTEFEIRVGTDNEWTDSGMWNPAPFNSPDTFVTYAGAALVDGSTYYLRLRVNNGYAWSPWYETSFRMNSLPAEPTVASPHNGTHVGPSVALYVNNSTDAEGDPLAYQFDVTMAPNIPPPLVASDLVPEQPDSTGWQVSSPLPDNEIFFWRCRAWDGFEYSNWSPYWFFAVDNSPEPPGTPTIVAPVGDSLILYDMLPTFSWTAVTDPDPLDEVKYRLELSLNQNFTPADPFDNLTDTSYCLPGSLSFNTHYWWRVTAFDLGGLFSVSDTADFWSWTLGDVSHDHDVTLGDIMILVDHLFITGISIDPPKVGDVNHDCEITLGDIMLMVDNLFISGAELQVGCE